MKFLKQIICIVPSAYLGYQLVQYYEKSGVVAVVMYFGVYIAVSIVVEGIWRLFAKLGKKE